MKFCELWLREWINPNKNSYILSEQITMLGLEVEKIKSISKYFNKILNGYIIEIYKHTKSKITFLIKVNLKINLTLNIISIYPDCKKNKNIVINFNKKNNKNEFIKCILHSVKKSNILKKYNEIIKLKYKINKKNIKKYLQTKDNIITINITPNRSDCLCLNGISRDIAIKNKIKPKKLIIKKINPSIKNIIPIFIDEPEACPKYSIRILKNINTNINTPLWIKEKLNRCGFNSVNIVIDITNYVMIELGQPINIYDLNKIYKGIIIRKTKKKELIKLPNNIVIKITPKTLIISDYKKILNIAGVLSNPKYTFNKKKTKNILIECACFNPIEIKKNIKLYKLYKNNKSNYYEKGIDPFIQLNAIERVSELLINICKGEIGPVINITNPLIFKKPKKIILKKNDVNRIIGKNISNKNINLILNNLGFQIKYKKNIRKILIPSWRFDINIKENLIEEIIRINGYNLINNMFIYKNLKKLNFNKKKLNLTYIKNILVCKGYQEIITYSFVNPKKQKLLHLQSGKIIQNPVSKDMSAMRLSLWTGLINTLIYNQKRQQQHIRLFESGLRFIPDNKINTGIRQDYMLAGLINGLRYHTHWSFKNCEIDFFDIKGDIETIFEITNKLDLLKFKKYKHTALHPQQSAAIFLKKKLIGFIGAINPLLEKKLKLKNKTFLFEFIWKKINTYSFNKIKNISFFPSNKRDISIIVKNDILIEDILNECKKTISDQLVEINLLDIYINKKIKKNHKSLTISLTIQDIKKTLNEQEISIIIKKCTEALKTKFNAYLRI